MPPFAKARQNRQRRRIHVRACGRAWHEATLQPPRRGTRGWPTGCGMARRCRRRAWARGRPARPSARADLREIRGSSAHVQILYASSVFGSPGRSVELPVSSAITTFCGRIPPSAANYWATSPREGRGRPHLVHQHTYPHFSSREPDASIQRLLCRTMLGRRPFIAVAPHVRDGLVTLGIPETRIHVIPNGVPLPSLAPPSDVAPIRVGLLGRFDPGKGMLEFAEAARRTRLAPGEAAFTIGGSRARSRRSRPSCELRRPRRASRSKSRALTGLGSSHGRTSS